MRDTAATNDQDSLITYKEFINAIKSPPDMNKSS
jgi:hypothetical protein